MSLEPRLTWTLILTASIAVAGVLISRNDLSVAELHSVGIGCLPASVKGFSMKKIKKNSVQLLMEDDAGPHVILLL